MPAIYTRTGDKGSTGLFGGTRVPKQAEVVETYGTVDEANSAIGVAKAQLHDEWADPLHQIQVRLFSLAAELASDAAGKARLGNCISEADVTGLEHLIDACLAITGAPTHFVVPGRDPATAALHQARTIVRRAERQVLRLAETEPVRDEIIRYLNRLSDTLYAIARVEEDKADRAYIEQVVRRAVGTVLGGSRTELDLNTAQSLAAAAECKAAQLGVPVVVAVVDAGGNLILVHRMADSLLASLDIAINKAYTATALKMATADLRAAAGVDGPLYGIEASNQGRLILFGGGLPVFAGERILGGIGVSGGTVDEDIAIVTYAYDEVLRS